MVGFSRWYIIDFRTWYQYVGTLCGYQRVGFNVWFKFVGFSVRVSVSGYQFL